MLTDVGASLVPKLRLVEVLPIGAQSNDINLGVCKGGK